MTSTPFQDGGEVGPEDEQIDPSWWALAEGDQSEDPDFLALGNHLRVRAEATDGQSLKGKVLRVLADVSTPMLVPGDWSEPFHPYIVSGNQRSFIPTDFSPDQFALLARLAPLISDHQLKARAADVAWTYGDRSDRALLALAIDAYRKSPVEAVSWSRGGEDHWRRAFDLARRRGGASRVQYLDMTRVVESRLLLSEPTDRFFPETLSKVLADWGLVERAVFEAIAVKLEELGGHAATSNGFRLSRHLLRQAANWYEKAGKVDMANGCVAGIAQSYVSEADERHTVEAENALIAGRLIENAISHLTSLPKVFRQTHQLDDKLISLEQRLRQLRLSSLEEMAEISSEAIDITGYVERARASVTGLGISESLLALALISPITDVAKAKLTAGQAVHGSLSGLFTRDTFSSDGRKVRSTGPNAPVDGKSLRFATQFGVTDERIWLQMVTEFTIRVGLVSHMLLIPAYETTAFEHRFSFEFLVDLCSESPVVPSACNLTWAKALWHGLSGDCGSAAYMLMPQIEQLVRNLIKGLSRSTLLIDERGVEREKGLSALLAMPESVDALGEGLAFELIALCCEPGGPNLRNDLAHGLTTDQNAWGVNAFYAWWLCLRIVLTTLTPPG